MAAPVSTGSMAVVQSQNIIRVRYCAARLNTPKGRAERMAAKIELTKTVDASLWLAMLLLKRLRAKEDTYKER